MNILIDILLVLCGMVIMAAWYQGRRPAEASEEYIDAYETGWDVGFESALEIVDRHLNREPVSKAYVEGLRKRAAL